MEKWDETWLRKVNLAWWQYFWRILEAQYIYDHHNIQI